MSISEELVERPLMTDEEIMRLPRDELLVFNAGHHPIRAKKLMYDKMPAFKRRAEMESPSRVEFAAIVEGVVRSHWFMVQCDAADNGAIKLCINTYDTFPPVSIVVKQENFDTDEVVTLDYTLTNEEGQEFVRELSVDDLQLLAVPMASARIDPREYFEVHFVLRDASAIPGGRISGFGRRLSDYEREARKRVKAHYYQLEEDTGKAADIRLERAEAGFRYIGTVILATSHYVALERRADAGAVSLHRIARLSRVPSVGEQVAIRYVGNKGTVA
ncbi:hypothetical protein AU476_40840 [Cupriavidus sp. UYMSc13B]|nr:hypothetical protein AU476_40840 [Cupriavidus sp. UYMSc13B]